MTTLRNNISGKGLNIEDVEKAINSIKPYVNKSIDAFVFGVHAYRYIKERAEHRMEPGLCFAGTPYFLVYSVKGTFNKILEVDKKSSIEELEKYLKAELGDLIDIEYMEILNFFKIQLGVKV